MNKYDDVNLDLANIESPFIELFSLLKRFNNSEPYTVDELIMINEHTENAISILLQGLQDLGQLIGLASNSRTISPELHHVGFFISAISNLTEALHHLRSDTDYILNQDRILKV